MAASPQHLRPESEISWQDVSVHFLTIYMEPLCSVLLLTLCGQRHEELCTDTHWWAMLRMMGQDDNNRPLRPPHNHLHLWLMLNDYWIQLASGSSTVRDKRLAQVVLDSYMAAECHLCCLNLAKCMKRHSWM